MHNEIRDMLFFQKSKLEMILACLKSEYSWQIASLFTGDASLAGLFARDVTRHAEEATASRTALKRLLGERTIREYAAACRIELNVRIATLADQIEELEAKCSDQSLTNKKLARAMEDKADLHAGNIFGPSVNSRQVSLRMQ